MQPKTTKQQDHEKMERGWYNLNYHERRKEFADERVEMYSILLEDGDFEKWQPCCYWDGGYTEEEWNQLKEEAYAMQPDPHLDKDSLEWKRQWCRIMWIKARFMVWLSPEWFKHQDIWLPVYYSIQDYLKSDWWKNKERDHHWSVGPTMTTPKEEAVDIRMERYGLFLEDGDFEKWQPCCYADGGYTKEEWLRLKEEASAIRGETIPEKVRTKWIQGRFIPWFSDEWQIWQNEYLELWQQLNKAQ